MHPNADSTRPVPPSFRTDLVNRYTVTLGAPSGAPDSTIIVGAPKRSASSVFAEARAVVVRSNGPVRILANGATVEENWPEWVRTWRGDRLRLTELDCYLPYRRAPEILALNAVLERWLDDTLAGTTPEGIAPRTVYWSSACDRWFHEWADDWMRAVILDESNADARIVALDPGWIGSRVLDARRRATGRPAVEYASPVKAVWSALTRVVGARLRPPATVALTAAALARRSWTFVRETPVRRDLARRQDALGAPTAPPRVWIGIVGNWERASRPVLEALETATSRDLHAIGVLLLHTLENGVYTSEVRGPARSARPLPVVDHESLRGRVARIEQAVSTTTARELGRVLVRAAIAGSRIAWRARSATRVSSDGISILEDWPLGKVAKLLAVETLRVEEASVAASSLVKRVALDGSTIIYPHITQANDCVGHQLVRRAGARSIELVHGLTTERDQLGRARTFTDVKALWTDAEADVIRRIAPHQSVVGGFMPRRPPAIAVRATLERSRPIRILVGSGYLSAGWALDPRARQHYQLPLLADVLASGDAIGPIHVRWRPHPGDDPALVRLYTERFPSLERSTEKHVEDDLRWCDLLVTSLSSVAIEALGFKIPVFVHQVPFWDWSAFAAFDPGRVFGITSTFREVAEPCVTLLRAGGDALGPERATLRRLFSTGAPRTIDALLDDAAPAELSVGR